MLPPTAEEAAARIRYAEQLDSDNASMEELVAAVKAVHLGCTVKIVTVEPGKRLFRAVRVDERPVHQSRISYPPPANLTQLGRANDIGQPLFYASIADFPGPADRSNMLACVWESKVKDGDLLAVGEWETTEPIHLYPFGFQAFQLKSMMRGNQPWINESEPKEAMSVINAWESQIFTRCVEPGNEHQYRLSVALTKYALNLRAEMGNTDRVSGITYPSVATSLYTDNICLTPEEADKGLSLLGVRLIDAKNMRLYEAREGRSKEEPVGSADVTIHDTSYPCNGSREIKWPERWIMRSTFSRSS